MLRLGTSSDFLEARERFFGGCESSNLILFRAAQETVQGDEVLTTVSPTHRPPAGLTILIEAVSVEYYAVSCVVIVAPKPT